MCILLRAYRFAAARTSDPLSSRDRIRGSVESTVIRPIRRAENGIDWVLARGRSLGAIGSAARTAKGCLTQHCLGGVETGFRGGKGRKGLG